MSEEATPWQEGYMEGRTPSGKRSENPHTPGTEDWTEWERGFEDGRDDGRQGV